MLNKAGYRNAAESFAFRHHALRAAAYAEMMQTVDASGQRITLAKEIESEGTSKNADQLEGKIWERSRNALVREMKAIK